MDSNNYPGKSKSLAALICGIVSVVFAGAGFGAIVAIGSGIAGILLSVQAKKELGPGAPNGYATAGLVCSIVGVSVGALVFVSCAACASCAWLFSGMPWRY